MNTQQNPQLHKHIVSNWHFLPELPEVRKEVLIAIQYDKTPIQGYWDGKNWKGSFDVRDNMIDGFVHNEKLSTEQWVYAWIELPENPPAPKPF